MLNLHGIRAFLARRSIRHVFSKTDRLFSASFSDVASERHLARLIRGFRHKRTLKLRKAQLDLLVLKIFFGIVQFTAKPDPCNG